MLRRAEAVVFDLDGVLVDTARLHARAWKRAFDSFFEHRGLDDSFDAVADYRRYVDGRPRYEGVASLLRSRDIEIPPGEPKDRPGFDTEAALGNFKNEMFHDLLDSEGVDVLPGAETLLQTFSAAGVPMAVVSSSRNAARVLPEHMREHIDVLLGGNDIEELGIPGKPEPGMFVEGARQLGAAPSSSAVIEDASVGVRAGRLGGFAVVIGVDPEGASNLMEHGADVVVEGVAALPHDVGRWSELIEDPLPALRSLEVIQARVGDDIAVFLDYDGTLTPIVDDPAAARLGDNERGILRRLAEEVPLAIVSGRGLDDVKGLVGVEGLTYAGSHGFEIEMPDRDRTYQEEAAHVVPQLDQAERLLLDGIGELSGCMVERKPYAIALHTRRAGSEPIREAAGALARKVTGQFDGLVLTGGKEVHELRPAIDWDKGMALSYLLELLPRDPAPVYVGDDDTDEDGFLAVRRKGGLGVLVGAAPGSETWADFTLTHPGETLEFLAHLAGSIG